MTDREAVSFLERGSQFHRGWKWSRVMKRMMIIEHGSGDVGGGGGGGGGGGLVVMNNEEQERERW